MHLSNYIGSEQDPHPLSVAVSYLQAAPHEWWISYKETAEGRQITIWSQFQKALLNRFETLNKVKVARDKLARWRQIKDVASFNENFQKYCWIYPQSQLMNKLTVSRVVSNPTSERNYALTSKIPLEKS